MARIAGLVSAQLHRRVCCSARGGMLSVPRIMRFIPVVNNTWSVIVMPCAGASEGRSGRGPASA